MKVLTVGGGGREHAAVEAFHRSGAEIYAVMKNANPGIIKCAKGYRLVDEKNVEAVCAYAKECNAELAFVGPEAPLEAGLVDALEKIGIHYAQFTQQLLDEGVQKFADSFHELFVGIDSKKQAMKAGQAGD